MLLISWNVNGLRSCLKKGFADSYTKLSPDIFCMQEIRLQDIKDVEESLRDERFARHREWHTSIVKKGYSGTAVFTSIPPLNVIRGFATPAADSLPDGEGRLLTLEFDSFYLVNVYTPNSQDGLRRIDYRMAWEDAFRDHLAQLDAVKPVILCGDLNVAHNEIDLAHPSHNRGYNGFSDEERGKMTELLHAGFIDTYRKKYPNEKGAYTWWSNIANARARNVGWRLDYFIVSERLWSDNVAPHIYENIMGSDHCPVGLGIDI